MRRHVLAVFVTVSSAVVGAEFVAVDVRNVPVERLVANLERRVAETPADVSLLINLARVHAMAFAAKSGTLPTHPPEELWLGQGVPPYRQFEVKRTGDEKTLAAARQHLEKAIRRYQDALARDPDNLIAKIGLGWAQVQAGERAAAIATLRDVVERAWPIDQKGGVDGRSPMYGQPYLTEEAARYLVPLLDPARDREEIATLRTRTKQLNETPRWITPIAVPLADALAASQIEDVEARVLFDADGTGVLKRWTWIRSNAAWLVIDRAASGRVTSALQMFGNVTYWMFWRNGYDALRALDDNGDGDIRGNELDGLALWHDGNGNGVSERGEVQPVGDWNIVALACAYEPDAAHPDEIAVSRRGVTFANGATRPTYDVILRTAAEPAR